MARQHFCAYCNQPLKPKSRDRFCSDKCRYLHSGPGAHIEFEDVPGRCVYCGMPSDSIDHVPPQSARQAVIDLGHQKRFPFVEVECCRECNSLLGARFWTVRDRRRYIRDKLANRYSSHLNMPDWSRDEIAALGHNLQVRIEHDLVIRDIVRQRIAFAAGRALKPKEAT